MIHDVLNMYAEQYFFVKDGSSVLMQYMDRSILFFLLSMNLSIVLTVFTV